MLGLRPTTGPESRIGNDADDVTAQSSSMNSLKKFSTALLASAMVIAGASSAVADEPELTNYDDPYISFEYHDGDFDNGIAITPRLSSNVSTEADGTGAEIAPLADSLGADLAVIGEWITPDPNSGPVETGTEFQVRVTIINNGPDSAINPVLALGAMSGNSLTFTSAHQVVFEAMGQDCFIYWNQVSCMLDELAPGESATFIISGTIATDTADLVEGLFDMAGFFAGIEATVSADNINDEDVLGLDDIWQSYVQVDVAQPEPAPDPTPTTPTPGSSLGSKLRLARTISTTKTFSA